MNEQKRITLAKIAGAHGVKGLIKIFPFGEDISLLERCPVFTKDGTPIQITLKNPSGKFILAEADLISTREQAIAAKGTELQINRDDLPEIEEDNAYYYEDLIGLKAIGEDGAEIGTVITVDNYGAGDLLEIR
ncbi:MAG: ribosome maturation factor RimM, partial [Alphaproteobacteria bacterium]